MSEEQKSNFDQENLNESSNQSSETSSRFRMPWNNKFGEDENLKNRQYSRSARNQPEREATTLSKVLLFMVICVCIVPFILFFWVNASRPQNPSPRTASQVQVQALAALVNLVLLLPQLQALSQKQVNLVKA